MATAILLVTCMALSSRASAGDLVDDLAGGGDPDLVYVSLGALVALTLPVLVLVALAFSAAMLQLFLGLTNTELAYRRCVHAVLVGSLPLAVRNVVLSIVVLTIGVGPALRLIQYGDPFVLGAIALLYVHLRSAEDVGRGSAMFASFFTCGFPLVLQILPAVV